MAKEKTKPKKKVKPKKPKSKKLKWYVVNSYVGQEKRVANLIKQRVKTAEMKHLVTKVVVPTQNKVIIEEGTKKEKEETIFPGYILVQMELNKETWPLVRDTNGVTGFSGTDRKPTPLPPDQVEGILKYMKVKQPTFKTTLMKGDAVELTEEPFKNMNGSVLSVDEEKGKAEVLLNIFGRETPVEVDIEKLKKL